MKGFGGLRAKDHEEIPKEGNGGERVCTSK